MTHSAIEKFLEDNLTLPSVVAWGKLPDSADPSAGTLNFFQLPSDLAANQQQDLRLQANAHHVTKYAAHAIADELMGLLAHYRGSISDGDGHTYYGHFQVNGDGGELEEEVTVADQATTVYMIPVYFTWVQIKAF